MEVDDGPKFEKTVREYYDDSYRVSGGDGFFQVGYLLAHYSHLICAVHFEWEPSVGSLYSGCGAAARPNDSGSRQDYLAPVGWRTAKR